MSPLTLFFFGTPRVERSNQPIPIRRRKGMALLVYLTITNQAHSREALATLLWPDFDQSRALSNLRREISRLKRDTGISLFLVNQKQISLNPEVDLWLDAEQFKKSLAIVNEHNHFPQQGCETCLAALNEAVRHYTDDFLAGFTLPDAPGFDEWHFFERESLRQLLSHALQKLINWQRRQNEFGAAVKYARRWLALDPLHEPGHRCLMALYAQDNQRAAALRQYEACARLLEEELGIEPEPATQDLYEAIRTRKFPPPQSEPTTRGDEALGQRNYLEAQSWFQEYLQKSKAKGDLEGMVYAWRGLGRTSMELDHLEMAQSHFLEALHQVQNAGDERVALLVLADLTTFYMAAKEPIRALEVGAFVMEHPRSGGEIKAQMAHLFEGISDFPAENLAEVRAQAGQRKIWNLVAELIADIDPSVSRARRTAVSHLPIPLTPFVGRNQELADIHHLLLDASGNRLLTLTGPGGIGKTRLAQEAAIQYRSNFQDGAFFVPLARVSSADLLTNAIAENVDYQLFGATEPTRQLLNFFSNKEMLLVLDNFENVIEEATIVTEILQAASQVRILVTSREALNISGEVVYHVHGLSFPAEETSLLTDERDYDAVVLLEQEAGRVRPEYKLEAEDLYHATRIVRLLQGMPLAVVMAASWLELLSLSEIADEIANNLSLLETTARDAPERQRSMRATFDYSWQRLQPSEQQVFMKLSVFRCGFNRQAAQAVSGADLRTLRLLVNKSFLDVDINGRFEIHELLRQYGWEYLDAAGEVAQVRDAHSKYFLMALQRREEDIKGKRQLETLEEIEADLENVRIAWQWAVQMERENLLSKSYWSLHLAFHVIGRYHEGVQLFHSASVRFAPDSDGQPRRLWRLLVPCLAYNAAYSGTATPKMKQDLEFCLELAEAEPDRFQEANCLLALSCYALFMEQEPGVAIPLLQRCLKLFRRLDEQFSVTLTLAWLGWAYGQNGEFDRFISLCQQSLDISLKTGNLVVASAAKHNLGFATIATGDYAAAEDHCRQALVMATKVGRLQSIALAQLHLGLLNFLRGELEPATAWAEKGRQIGEHINVDVTKSYAYSVLSLCASLSGDTVLARGMSEKSRVPSAVYYYRILSNWACAVSYSSAADDSMSWNVLLAALQQARDAKLTAVMTWLLPVAAILLERAQQPERATSLLALAFHHPQSAVGWVEKWALINDLRLSLQQELGADRYQMAWNDGLEFELESTVTNLLTTAVNETIK